jgi:hypothetical protein
MTEIIAVTGIWALLRHSRRVFIIDGALFRYVATIPNSDVHFTPKAGSTDSQTQESEWGIFGTHLGHRISYKAKNNINELIIRRLDNNSI